MHEEFDKLGVSGSETLGTGLTASERARLVQREREILLGRSGIGYGLGHEKLSGLEYEKLNAVPSPRIVELVRQ